MNEFQANEYLCMIEIERGDFEAAKSRCQNLLTIGEKLRQGSEAPFAQALNAVCDYSITQKDPGIDVALQLLRDVDAKQRLTYALNRVAMLDIKMENWDSAITRATEALEHAQVMDRASEVITARVVLAEAYQAQSQNQAYQEQLQALLDTPETVGAKWARDQAARLIENYNNQ
jgi:hypothetical protein